MTAALDKKSDTVRRLIDSCHEAQEEFHNAAEAVDDMGLKRLFALYAQQRTRFAEELRGYIPFEPTAGRATRTLPTDSFSTDVELLGHCLEKENQTISLYKEALADRAITTKTHFLISAQLALLERVRSRMESLRPNGHVTAIYRERVTL